MATNDPSIFDWMNRDRSRLLEAGGRKAQIVARYSAFGRLFHSDVEGADLAITEAVEAARAEDEAGWELFLRHWRVQLRLKDDLRRALPEAIDLLTLAEDPRVHDIPQRICSFHDVVYCHLAMDPVCYGGDTLENSESVLAQVPQRYDCADCARMNRATALAALGRGDEARAMLATFHANQNGNDVSWLSGEASVYLLMEDWEEAEKVARRAIERTRTTQAADEYITAHIILARALLEQSKVEGAGDALMECRRMTKYAGGSYLLAQLLEMDGRLQIALGDPGVDYLTRAAQRYLALGRYREAALAGLLAAERARDYTPPAPHTHDGQEAPSPAARLDPEPALDAAAQALGAVRAPEPALAARLAAFGRAPIAPAAETAPYTDAASGGVREGLEAELDAHLASSNPRGVATALYRLGAWLTQHEQPRAALDYLIMNGVIERALRLTHGDREDALLMLTEAARNLPAGSVNAAFTATERGAPARYAHLFAQTTPARWRWLVRSVAAEWRNEPVIEPEDITGPSDDDQQSAFMSWLEHTASMSALVLRFRQRADPAGVARWVTSLREVADESMRQTGEPNPLTTFAQALVALCEGQDAERALALAQPPFTTTVRQVVELAGRPVWEHPGNSPLEYFIEHDAQMAVNALRAHDDHSVTRRANMAFRFELQAIDLDEQKSLADVASFVRALAQTVRAEGAIPGSAQTLPDQFLRVLSAVSAAGATPAAGPEA